jgi:hypothetical protein
MEDLENQAPVANNNPIINNPPNNRLNGFAGMFRRN